MLKVDHLTKRYPGTQKVVTGVAPGDLYAFIGPNGRRKTTTLKSIVGIHGFDAGSITVNGISLRQAPLACKRQLAYIPDDPQLYEYLTGMQYLDFVADVFRVPDGERRSRIAQYAEDFGITATLGQLIGSYSHGMKQNLEILSAL